MLSHRPSSFSRRAPGLLLVVVTVLVTSRLAAQPVPVFKADPPWLARTGLGTISASRELSDGSILLASRDRTIWLNADGVVRGGGRLEPATGGLEPLHLAIDSDGGVFVGGSGPGWGTGELYLMKYDGRTGRPRWQAPRNLALPSTGYRLLRLAIAPGGDVVLLVQLFEQDLFYLVVLSVSGETGAPRWEATLPGTGNDYQASAGMAIDAGGGILVVSSAAWSTATFKVTAAGQLHWGPLYDPAGGFGLDAAVDPASGDLYYLTQPGPWYDLAYLWKRSGKTGTRLWGPARVDGYYSYSTPHLAVDCDGDAVVVTELTPYPSPGTGQVRRFSGVTGQPRFDPVELNGAPEAWALDAAGSVFVSSRGGWVTCLTRDGATSWQRAEALPANFDSTSTVLLSLGRVLHTWRTKLFGTESLGSDLYLSVLDASTGLPVSPPGPLEARAPAVVRTERLVRIPDGPLVVNGTTVDAQRGTTVTAAFAVDVEGGVTSWGPVFLPFPYPAASSGYRSLAAASTNGLILAGADSYTPSAILVASLAADGSVRWGPLALGAGLPAPSPAAVATDSSGNAFVLAGTTDGAELYRLDGTTGATDFHASLPDVGPLALAVLPGGAPVLFARNIITRLGLTPGQTTWTAALPNFYSTTGSRVFVDAKGDVLAATSRGSQSMLHPLLYKLDGENGGLIWGPVNLLEVFHTGAIPSSTFEVDSHGDMLVAGNLVSAGTSRKRVGIVKVSGQTGDRLWGPTSFEHGPDGSDSISHVATTPGGEVLAVILTTFGGSAVSTARLVRYDSSTGAMVGPPHALPFVPSAILADGDRLFLSDSGRIVAYRLGGLGISALLLPDGVCGTTYTADPGTRNGASPLSHAIVSGSLPPGLALDGATGRISGTPLSQGLSAFTLSVIDAAGAEARWSYEIEVGPRNDLAIPTPAALCPGETVPLTAPAGFASYRWLRDGETSPFIFVSPSEATTYGVEALDEGGCAHRGDVRVEVAPLRRPPDVVAPDAVLVRQTGCAGGVPVATAAGSPALAAFLQGGAAFDRCEPGLLRLPPQVSGVDVGAETPIPAGGTTVVFRFLDPSGNVGEAPGTLTVQAYGDLDASARLDVFDSVILAGYLVGNVSPGAAPFTGAAFAADVNDDGVADLFDLVLLMSSVVGNVPCLPPGA